MNSEFTCHEYPPWFGGSGNVTSGSDIKFEGRKDDEVLGREVGEMNVRKKERHLQGLPAGRECGRFKHQK